MNMRDKKFVRKIRRTLEAEGNMVGELKRVFKELMSKCKRGVSAGDWLMCEAIL
jgi:hypothetical protein